MKPTRWTVYCHTHNESGRKYIGLTKYTMMHRWNQHVSQSARSVGGRWHFPNAIRKYGKDAFSHKILETFNTLEEANKLEEKYIKEFDTRNPEKGFNIMRGGNHIPHPINNEYRKDPEYIKQSSLAAKARWQNPEIRFKNLAANKIAHNTPEYKEKASIVSKEIHSRPEVKTKLRESTLRLAETGIYSSEDFKSKMSEIAKQRTFSEERLKNQSKASKKLWEDKDYQNKMVESQKAFWSGSEGQQIIENSKEKISAALKGRKLLKSTINKIIEKRRQNDEKRCAAKTYKICKIHGKILLQDCYKRPKPTNGFFRYDCKICLKVHKEKRK
jgi:hypothetical protein